MQNCTEPVLTHNEAKEEDQRHVKSHELKELEQEKVLLKVISEYLSKQNQKLQQPDRELKGKIVSDVTQSITKCDQAVNHKVDQLQEPKLSLPRLFYVVLIDLAESTKASVQLSPDENIKRIKQFVGFTVQALNERYGKNLAMFVKEIGDAALFLFTNFQDILDWVRQVDELLKSYNDECIKNNKPEIYQMASRTCAHIGEVHFTEDSDPISLAINQIFKIEKEFKKGQLGITDDVKQVILPRINSGQIKAEMVTKTALPGEDVRRPLWKLTMEK